MRKHTKTNEEKVAEQIAKQLTNITIDLDQVGLYFARSIPTVIYNRLMLVAESAEWEKENGNRISESSSYLS